MSARTPLHGLDDIAETSHPMRAAMENISKDQYMNDPDLWAKRRAMERGIEIISEASRSIPAELKNSAPQLAWQKITGIGNVLRHEYHKIDDGAIYDVITIHLESLEQQVLA